MAERTCPVCQASSATMFLHREAVPVCQNLIMEDERSARAIPRGDLSLCVCDECGFVFNRAFEASALRYGANYDNTQTCSPFFTQYVDTLIDHLVSGKRPNLRIVEVGCGNGSFLRGLVEASGLGSSGYGFDPSYAGPVIDLGGRLRFERRYYGPECVDIAADLVICRHVIEHVPDPVALLRTIGQSLTQSSHATVFLETPCVEWILRNNVIWDFFYEHCSYFSEGSLTAALELAGFTVQGIRRAFGGQYLWLEAAPLPPEGRVTFKKTPGLVPKSARRFAAAEERLIAVCRRQVAGLSRQGRVALWGAGAKGVTLANLLDPDRGCITCVVDLNPNKQGCYVPGTGHPIVGYHELAKYDIKWAVLMNPNYRDENASLLREASLDVALVDLADVIRGSHETDN